MLLQTKKKPYSVQGDDGRRLRKEKPRYRFPSLVLPSSGSEGLLSAVPSRCVETECTPNGTIKHMMKKNENNIQGQRELVKP